MAGKQLRLALRFQKLIKKLSGGEFARSNTSRSLILVLLLFFVSMAVPLLLAPVSLSIPSVQGRQVTAQLVERARRLYQSGQFEEAAAVWQQLADILAARGDRLNQAMASSNLSLTDQQMGKWDGARAAIAQSVNLLQALTSTPERQRILAFTLDIQGQLQLAIGQPENALQTWQQAADLYEEIGSPEGVVRSQINRAQAMQDLGLYPRACETLLDTLGLDSQGCKISEAELQSLKPQQSPALQISGLHSLGNVLRTIGQSGQSQIALLKSWQLARQLENYPDLGAIYLSLGNTARALGNKKLSLLQPQSPVFPRQSITCIPETNYDTADEFYRQAEDCYRQAAMGAPLAVRVQAGLNLLGLSLQNGRGKEVAALLTSLPSQIDRLPPSLTAISAQLKLAQNFLCLQGAANGDSPQLSQAKSNFSSPILQSCPVRQGGKTPAGEVLSPEQIPQLPEIRQRITAALRQAQVLGDWKAEASALGYLAAVSQQAGKWAEAQQLTERALQGLSSFDTPELAYLWQWQLGRLYQIQEKPKEAIAAYTLAFQLLQSLRQDLVATNPDIQFTFRDSVEPVYRELVDLLLRPSPTPLNRGEVSQDNLTKARDVIEALQLAELNNFFQEACLEGKPQPIDQIDARAAVIYSIILPERLAVILSIPGQPLGYYETALDPSLEIGEVERAFDNLFANLNPNIYSSDLLVPYQQFYDWLVRPAARELAENDIQTLVFVLDGVLRGVPVSALYDGQQYLIEQYNVALTPGLQLFNPRRLSLERMRVLVGGLTESRQGFPALPGVREEVKEIAEIAASAEILLDGEFTRTQLSREIQRNDFPIVHLATHGQFSSRAEDTFLLTWDEKIDVKNLDRLLREQDRFAGSPIELLILSACETAVGDKRAALGLAGFAVRSGARSTVATLWSVEDRSTADFMTHFYEVLNRTDISKADALRQAQLSLLLHSPQDKYQHPFYWAPFVLVGNWL